MWYCLFGTILRNEIQEFFLDFELSTLWIERVKRMRNYWRVLGEFSLNFSSSSVVIRLTCNVICLFYKDNRRMYIVK